MGDKSIFDTKIVGSNFIAGGAPVGFLYEIFTWSYGVGKHYSNRHTVQLIIVESKAWDIR